MTESEQIRILRENVRLLSERSVLSHEQRQICLSEILDRLLPTVSEEALEEAYHTLCRHLPECTESDRAQLFLRYARSLSQKRASTSEKIFFLGEERVDPQSRGRIALVKNRYNEEAYRQFAPPIAGAKEYTVPSFADACEEIASNRCEFAILPLENTRDGRLFGFYSMLDRYELKICAASTLETEEPAGSTRYALVGRSYPARIPKNCPWNLEFSLAIPLEKTPLSILSTAELFSARLLGVDSLSVPYDDQLRRFYFTFRVPREHATALHLFCSLEYSRYTPLGLYPIL